MNPPAADVFHRFTSYQECRDTLYTYLRKAGRKIPEQERMAATLQVAFCEVVLNHINEGQNLLQQCSSYILLYGREEEKALVYHTQCRLKIHFAKFSEALDDGLKALYIFRQHPYRLLTLITSTCCGVACSNLNLFTEGIDHLTESHRIAVSMGDVRSALLATANLNEIRMRILPVDDCIAYNKELLTEIYNEYGNKPSVAEAGTCVHLGYLYSRQKEYTLASSYADRALGVMQQFDYLPPHHFLYTNIFVIKAEVAGSLGDEKAMLRYAQDCVERARIIHKATPEIDVDFLLFRFYAERKQLRKAKRYLDKAAALIPDTDRGSLYHDLIENRCLYYAATGDTARELQYFRLMYDYKIKAEQQGLNSRIQYINTIHALELKQKEVDQHKAELDFKTQELNMTTYHLQQRTQLLNDLKESIATLRKENHRPDTVFKTISRAIDQAFAKEESEKDRFREKFDEAHRGFIVRLHRAHPTLSPTECRICALLRSGFNTKDIASLLSSSPRNIENHRVTIRRKMHLTREDNLNLVLTAIE
ncbi:MAG: response regulator transcription factor [Bacteroidetes bacterium]|nr:response regulator transcription factor [Bacteroidota bacterium]